MTDREKEIKEQLTVLYTEQWVIQAERNKPMVGKYVTYDRGFSDVSEPSFGYIQGLKEGYLEGFEFTLSERGYVSINPKTLIMPRLHTELTEITKDEFDAEWANVVALYPSEEKYEHSG